MRDYQENIYNAILSKRNWGGGNVVVNTENNITKVWFYGNLIGVIDHANKTYKCDNCGFTNAIKMACEEMKYSTNN